MVESHTHTPPTHCWPAPHAAPPPQPQVPAAQVLPFVHTTHAAPLLPQAAAVVGETQAPPWQQPLGQVVESQPVHMPASQVEPVMQL